MSAALAEYPVGPGPAMRRRLSGFVRTLRDSGYAAGQAETVDAARIIACPLADRPERLREALKALFATSRAEAERFDEVFDAFWRGRGARTATRTATSGGAEGADRRFGAGPGGGDVSAPEPLRAPAPEGVEGEGRGRERGASTFDSISKKDFAKLTGESERAAAHELAERLARAMRARLTRRERARAKGRRLDLSATIRRSVARGGEPIDLKFRQRKSKPLRLVALLDASGSMELYVSVFTRFLHAISQTFRQSEAYLFHTRLAHVSAALREPHPPRALDRLSLMAAGVGGGTKIGDCLAEFNRAHAKRALNSRSCVMIFSDGYDTGEPERLAAAMRDLRRRCRRIVWLDPLTGREGFQPIARGLLAAMPYIDLFAPAHDLASLAALEPYLARL